MENLLATTGNSAFTENIIFKAKIHWISFIIPSIYMIVGVFGFYGLNVKDMIAVKLFSYFLVYIFLKALLAFLRILKTDINLSEKRLTIITGVFGRTTSDISLSKLEGMSLFQTFGGRLFGYGQLTVTTGEVAYTYRIKKPMELRAIILKQISML
jgi:uncharacterized membrane protein YdbT with pleckstrin-like domain